MEKLLGKMGINGKLRANFGAIVILALGVSVISGLPFFRFDYYEVYVSTYHLTNTHAFHSESRELYITKDLKSRRQ